MLVAIVFVNACLLFIVEPMFSKLVLPILGGTPSVWNTCLVFFQAALLVGYVYAHALTRIRSRRLQVGVHALLLGVSCLSLPLSVRALGDPPVGDQSIAWLIGLLVISLGAPFVMLASGAPLAQRLLAGTGNPNASNPYFLYAASNLGSLVALLAYPVLVEPQFTLSQQRLAWSAAYAILAVVIVVAFGGIALRYDSPAQSRERTGGAPITAMQRGKWVLYSAVPSGLLVAVTTFISTDVAAVPLLWIIPLALYLLTFAIVFSRRPSLPHEWMVRAAPHALVIISIPFIWMFTLPGIAGVLIHLAVLFVVGMVCHGELVSQRPAPSQLTEFYVCIGFGGLAGGAATALLAPIIFDRVYEYRILLAIAAMLLPGVSTGRKLNTFDVVLPLALGAAALAITREIQPLPHPAAFVATVVIGLFAFSFRHRPVRFGLALGCLFVAGHIRNTTRPNHRILIDAERSYFGAYRVSSDAAGKLIMLHHGTTLHGAQPRDPAHRLVPVTYYHPDGPAGDVFRFTPAGVKQLRSVAVVGLGTGSLACFGRPAESWTYYEIDPLVARIATNPRDFTYLRDCPPGIRVVFGDARLTLKRSPAKEFDIVVLDAFSSDAVPVHLLTREAFREYLGLLNDHGVIAVHISNDHVDLDPVVAAAAASLKLFALVRRDFLISPEDAAEGMSPSVWAVLARSRGDLGLLGESAQWVPLHRRSDVAAWTDDFSNIIRVFNWR